MSELIRCLTLSWFERNEPTPLTEKQLAYFSIGFALEDVFLRDPGELEMTSEQIDGIWLTPDYVDLSGIGVDLKSTRMYFDKNGVPSKGWPESWLKQFMGYAKYLGITEYGVAVMQLIKADFVVGTFTFTPEEIEANWQWLVNRKVVLDFHMAAGEPPAPFVYNQDWECNNCARRLKCGVIAQQLAEDD